MYGCETHIMAKQIERELALVQSARLARLGGLDPMPGPFAGLRGWLSRRTARPVQQTATPQATRTRAATSEW